MNKFTSHALKLASAALFTTVFAVETAGAATLLSDGFQSPTLTTPSYTDNSVSDWTHVGGGGSFTYGIALAGTGGVPDNGYTNEPAGTQYAYLSNGSLFSSALSANLTSGENYNFTVDVGNRTDQSMSDLGIKLLVSDGAGGWVTLTPTGAVATYSLSVNSEAITSDSFANFGFALSSSVVSSTYSAYVGNALRVELWNQANGEQVNFDNVTLSATAVPEPTALTFLGATGMLIFAFRRRRHAN